MSRACDCDNCVYRSLYEGSQASLSDMAGKQAGALNRTARLRSAIVNAIKQAFPAEFNTAEAQLGKRISKTEDEVLIAYLNGFLTTERLRTVTGPDLSAIADLRAALTVSGVSLPASNNLSLWASAVIHAAGAAASEPSQRRSLVQVGAAVAQEDAGHVPATSKPASAGARTAEPLPEPEDYQDLPPDDDGLDLSELFDTDNDDLFSDGSLSTLFQDAESNPDDLISALFDDGPSGTPETPVIDDTPAAATGTASRPAKSRPIVRPEPEPAPAPEPEPAASSDPPPAAPTGIPSSIWDSGGSAISRPALFPEVKVPSAKSRRGPRTPRVSRVTAVGPGDADLDVPSAAKAPTTGGLTDDIAQQLVAAVCIPRPVFLRDLAEQVGSHDLVTEWKERCFADSSSSEVRFIFPKPRHAGGLEDLVVPYKPELRDAAGEFNTSWWASCLKELRGTQLYEVAVLLHRFGNQVVSSKIDGKTVVLRLNQPRGLVGVVVALAEDLDVGDATRKQVSRQVKDLLDDRLSMVAVLTTSGRPPAVDNLARAVKEDAEAGMWSATTPVIASRSWDFASDGGASALAVR